MSKHVQKFDFIAHDLSADRNVPGNRRTYINIDMLTWLGPEYDYTFTFWGPFYHNHPDSVRILGEEISKAFNDIADKMEEDNGG